MADVFALSERDTILQLVPVFHANGWGIPYAGIMTGAKLVLCGRHLQPADIAQFIDEERVTFSGGISTLWMTLYTCLEAHPKDISSVRSIVAAGAALPRQFVELYQRKYGLRIMLAWGMTEITPIGTVTALKSALDCLPDDRRFKFLSRHGIPLAGIDIRIVNDEGKEAAWDGATMGELQIRGPWVTSGYLDDPQPGERLHIQITDRTRDLIKSGGD